MEHNTLMHYGVLGMKWGRRKAGRTSSSEDYKKFKQIRKKRLNEMSNQELRDFNNRMELEQRYKNLTKKTNYGKKAVNTFIQTAVTITAITSAAKTYKKVGNIIADKLGDAIISNIKL